MNAAIREFYVKTRKKSNITIVLIVNIDPQSLFADEMQSRFDL